MYLAAFDDAFSSDGERETLLACGRNMVRGVGIGRRAGRHVAMSLVAVLLLSGCTSIREWWHNGLKVGPDYSRPTAPVAAEWIDDGNPAIRTEPARYRCWWTVFDDPVLNQLVDAAYQENLPLKVAGLRILEARAQRGIATGNLFAQLQEMTAAYSRTTSSGTTSFGGIGTFPKAYFQRWTAGFDATWELDFWGAFRREVEAADANLSAQIANYDDVLVILQAEVAATYVDIRTLDERLQKARENVKIQEQTLKNSQDLLEVGGGSVIDVERARADWAITKAAIPLLETSYRQAQNKLCVLLGIPPQDIQEILAENGSIPEVSAEAEILVGIPAELLRRRPDIRRAERQVAAQSARIGVATADLYPHFTLTGSIGLESVELRRLFSLRSVAGTVGPGFRWNILNYGRILNNIRTEDARFRQSVFDYQQTVLKAHEEVENAIIAYLLARQRVKPLLVGAAASKKASDGSSELYYELGKYKGVKYDFEQVLDSQRVTVRAEDQLAEGQGNVALTLIALYKALGGGWRVRCPPEEVEIAPARIPAEVVPAPAPESPPPTSHDSLQRIQLPADPPAPPGI